MLLLSVSSYSVEEIKNIHASQCFVTAGVMTEARKEKQHWWKEFVSLGSQEKPPCRGDQIREDLVVEHSQGIFWGNKHAPAERHCASRRW